MSVPAAIFGPGIVIATRTDIANRTPINVGYAQELSLDFSATSKDLFGQNQFALVTARGTIKATAKLKAAVLSGFAFNTMFVGQSFTAGGFVWNVQEAGTIPSPTGPYTYQTINHTTFDQDLGVTYAATGLPFQKVASGPTVGQYSQASGTYTFAAADAGLGILVTYTNTQSSIGQKLSITNQLIGTTPTFQLDYYNNLNQPGAEPFAVRLYACIGSKFALAGKLEDFSMPEYDLGIFANASQKVMDLVLPQVA
jgi:hypothetical protein